MAGPKPERSEIFKALVNGSAGEVARVLCCQNVVRVQDTWEVLAKREELGFVFHLPREIATLAIRCQPEPEPEEKEKYYSALDCAMGAAFNRALGVAKEEEYFLMTTLAEAARVHLPFALAYAKRCQMLLRKGDRHYEFWGKMIYALVERGLISLARRLDPLFILNPDLQAL